MGEASEMVPYRVKLTEKKILSMEKKEPEPANILRIRGR